MIRTMLPKACPLFVASIAMLSTASFAADTKSLDDIRTAARATAIAAAEQTAKRPNTNLLEPGRYFIPSNFKMPRKEVTKWDRMEHGPFLSSYMDVTPKINKAVSINLGNGATVCFDTEMCKLALGWKNGFVRLPTGRDGLEGMPRPYGTNIVWGKPDTNGVRKILRADDADIVFTTPPGPGWADADGNFSDKRPEFKGRKYGPLPREHAKWKGIYLDGDTAVLSYTVGKASVLEKPGYEKDEWTRTFEVENATQPLTVVLFRSANPVVKGGMFPLPISRGSSHATFHTDTQSGYIAVTGLKTEQVHIITTNSMVALRLDVIGEARFKVAMAFGEKGARPNTPPQNLPPALTSFKNGGAPRWGEPILVPGKLSTNTTDAYVMDTLTVPEKNPHNSWIRCSGIDFFSDGTRAAVCSVSGDVWLLSNIDDKLDRVTWKRYATGLFQPLGLKIVDDKVYVLGRDQITRLHDLNNDGEADFYENFNNDVGAFQEYHEFAHDLQVDSQGNFYFAKGGNLGDAKHPHNGCVIKVSKDGSKLETVACGLRAPNGMGMGPHDETSVSDNQGDWVPASRFEIIKPGGFYGHVFNAYRTSKPTSYDNPVCWIPHPYPDNSSGGQVWVKGDRWGPFQDEMLFMSYGQCLLFKVLLDKVDGEYQGGVVRFPFKCDSGIMRARFNEKDGQLYVTGLSVWQSNAAKQGAVHRIRYTGRPVYMPTKLHATKRGVELTFTSPLDEASVADLANWNVEEWDYKWSSSYGSPEFKHSLLSNREEFEKAGTAIQAKFSVPEAQARGHDKVEVKSAKLSADKKTVLLEMPNIHPVMQMKITANIKAADGKPIKQDVWNSIWKLAAK